MLKLLSYLEFKFSIFFTLFLIIKTFLFLLIKKKYFLKFLLWNTLLKLIIFTLLLIASIANNEILGSFGADISGTNARLLFTPTYRNNTIKYIRTGITVWILLRLSESRFHNLIKTS